MHKKYITIVLCNLLAFPIHAAHPNPFANDYGAAETKEEFLQLLRQDIEHAQARAAAGDEGAYRYVAKRLDAGYKHNWLMKNPGTALLYFVGGSVALVTLLVMLGRR